MAWEEGTAKGSCPLFPGKAKGGNGMEETDMEDTGMEGTGHGRGTDPGSLMEENRRLEEENNILEQEHHRLEEENHRLEEENRSLRQENGSLKQVMLEQAGLYAKLAAQMERTDMSIGLLMDLCRDSRETAQTGYGNYEDRRDRTDER